MSQTAVCRTAVEPAERNSISVSNSKESHPLIMQREGKFQVSVGGTCEDPMLRCRAWLCVHAVACACTAADGCVVQLEVVSGAGLVKSLLKIGHMVRPQSHE